MPDHTATVVACLTPPGQGAIATLGLAGPGAWTLARALFRPRTGRGLPDDPCRGRFWLGRCGDEVSDDVVLAVVAVEPVLQVEIHSHGGRAVVGLLLDLFTARGCRPCSWPEFLGYTGTDPLRIEAAVALAQATTTRTAAVLLDQYHGAFGDAVAAAVGAVDRGEIAEATALVAGMARRVGLGRRLTEPWRVVVAGAPNVGKSSLVNALAGYQRSIVAPTPGTTRDVVTARIAVDGWPIELTDTAGLRDVTGSIEGQGIERARSAAAGADLCLWVLDASTPPVWPETESSNRRIVVNKIDLPALWDLCRAGEAVHVSAVTGEGLPALCAALARWLVPEPPPAGAAVPFTATLGDAIEEVVRAFAAGEVGQARAVLQRLPGVGNVGGKKPNRLTA
jgi:tRNA modification GTPase